MTQNIIDRIRSSIRQAMEGKDEVVELVLTAFLARGHLLLEDLPGLGKTTLARALAKSISGQFSRIQFTPDLMPSDVTGTSVFNQKTGEFSWRAGPIFSNVVLADELNRATPRSQSALLEGMSERQVSADGATRPLPTPFMVIATQNPIEHAGTYPLPESQLDRFLMRIEIGYPSPEDEKALLRRADSRDTTESLSSAVSLDEVKAIQAASEKIEVEPAIDDYIIDIAHATRRTKRLLAGVSPRACLDLRRAVQAYALLRGRDYCLPDDVKHLAPNVFGHRVIDRAASGTTGTSTGKALIESILTRVEVPV